MNKKWDLAVTFGAAHLSLIFYIFTEKVLEIGSRGYWAPILTGLLLEFLLLKFYISGLSAYPKTDLPALFQTAGKWTARIVLFPLVLYFFISIVLLVRSYAEMLTIILLPRTPIWAVMVLLLAVPLQASWLGLRGILRGSASITLLFLPIIIASFLTCFQNIDFHYLFPFQPDSIFWATKEYIASLFAITGFLFIGFTASEWNMAAPSNQRSLFIAFALVLPIYLLSVYIPFLMFGHEAASKFRFPLSVAVDTVNFEWLIFNKFSTIYTAATISFGLVFITLLLWSIYKAVSALYLPSSRPLSQIKLSWIVIAAVLAAGLWITDWKRLEFVIALNTPLRLYCLFLIPLLTWGIGRAKRRRTQG